VKMSRLPDLGSAELPFLGCLPKRLNKRITGDDCHERKNGSRNGITVASAVPTRCPMHTALSVDEINDDFLLGHSALPEPAGRTVGRPDGLRTLAEELGADPKWHWISSLSAMLGEMQQSMRFLTSTARPSLADQCRTAERLALEHPSKNIRPLAERYQVLLRIHSTLTARLTDMRSALGPAAESMFLPAKQTDQGLSRWQERRAKSYLNRNLGTRVSNAEVAAVCGLSQNYFVTAFRKRTGETPHACLTRYRVERAKELLGGTMGLADVALSCGFSDQSHLTRVFRKHTGVGPGSWRREQRDAHHPDLSTTADTPPSRKAPASNALNEPWPALKDSRDVPACQRNGY
jgi:AraC-like DNA-binding protein